MVQAVEMEGYQGAVSPRWLAPPSVRAALPPNLLHVERTGGVVGCRQLHIPALQRNHTDAIVAGITGLEGQLAAWHSMRSGSDGAQSMRRLLRMRQQRE